MGTPTTDGTRESRAERRARTEREILALGRTHLASDGAAALSLRAIARDLGMVSSAIYRYVESRDELLTRLLVEAYDDLADTVTSAVDAVPPTDHRERLRALASSFRDWAHRDPARYALLYGSPVPGYHAPPERTVGPGTRVIALALAQIDAAAHSGALVEPDASYPRHLAAGYDELRAAYGLHLSDAQVTRTFVWWAGLLGVVSQDVFDGYGGSFTDINDALFDAQVDVLIDLLVSRGR